jgi:hypothetical protein
MVDVQLRVHDQVDLVHLGAAVDEQLHGVAEEVHGVVVAREGRVLLEDRRVGRVGDVLLQGQEAALLHVHEDLVLHHEGLHVDSLGVGAALDGLGQVGQDALDDIHGVGSEECPGPGAEDDQALRGQGV